jgi:hypothetical protein
VTQPRRLLGRFELLPVEGLADDEVIARHTSLQVAS